MRLVALACVLVLASGCVTGGTPDAGAEELSRQAQTLVPDAAEVVDISEGACVQLDVSPKEVAGASSTHLFDR